MIKIISFGLLYLLSAFGAAACPTFHGVDYSQINARQVLVEGLVRSVRTDEKAMNYVFELTVHSTLKGQGLPSWTVFTEFRGTHFDEWPEKGNVYVGFDVIDSIQGIGHFVNAGCEPLGIVPATAENLKKIKLNIRETAGF